MEQNQNGQAKQQEIKINQQTKTPDEKLNPDESRSTETAGPIRGFFRSLSSRFSVGRLPTKIPSPPRTTLPAPNIPKNIPRLNPVKARSSFQRLVRQRRGATIAKVSDAASTGLDAVSSVNTNQEEGAGKDHPMTKESNNQQRNWRGTLSKSFHFTASFVQNSILGTAVFEAYEYSLLKFIPKKYPMKDIEKNSQNLQNITSSKTWLSQPTNPNPSTTVVPYHFLAGGIAGITHGILSSTFDSIQSLVSNRERLWQSMKLIFVSMNRNTFTSIAHHSISHSILFGSYEFWKQTFSSSVVASMLQNGQEDRSIPSKPCEYQYGEWDHIVGITMAGGIAGSSQNFISHYTEYFLLRDHGTSLSAYPKIEKTAGIRNFSIRNVAFHLPMAPSLRSILVAFPQTAIGFVAFEYGKEIGS